MIEVNKVYLGDCVDWLKKVDDESIHLVVTSPPYKDIDGYSDSLMFNVFQQCYRVLCSNCLFFLNFGHLAEDKFRPFKVCQIAIECGFRLNDTITWRKNHYRPIQGKKRLNNLTEFIFLLYKEKMPELDRLAIGVPYVDSSNAKRFNNGLNLKCCGNCWDIPYETIQKKSQRPHSDIFPLALPQMCIKLAHLNKPAIVFDPFSGYGTTALAAKNLGYNYIGFEKNEYYYNLSLKRLEDKFTK